jgi:hypothetical protein
MKRIQSLFVVIFGLLTVAFGPAEAAPKRIVQLAVDIRYYYGQWNWGDFKMAPRAGIAGPNLRLELLGSRLTLTSAYQSGNFSATGATALDDISFHSRKNFTLRDSRELFEIGLEYRLHSTLALAVTYVSTQYDLKANVDLNSDQRLYGSGTETAINETKGLGLGIRPHLKLQRNLSFNGEAIYFPRLKAEAAGTYQYQLFYRDGNLDERWFGETDIDGFKLRGEITYGLIDMPITLSAGYFYQRFEEIDANDAGWLDEYLLGQSRNRSWRSDQFHGFTARAGFVF